MRYSSEQNLHCCGVQDVGDFFDVNSTDDPKKLREGFLQLMQAQQVGLLQATTTASARTQARLLRESGWVEVRRFRNPKTRRIIISWHFTK